MKKSYLLLPIALLALASCNKNNDAGDGDGTPGGGGGGSPLAVAVAALENINEYKVTSSSELRGVQELMPGLKATMVQTSKTEEIFKGSDYSMDMSKIEVNAHMEMKVSDFATAMGIPESYIKLSLPYIVEQLGYDDGGVEGENVWFEKKGGVMGDGVVYLHFGENGEQSYYGEFVDGEYAGGEYVPNYYIDQSMFALESYTKLLKENLDKATESDGVYSLDISANPIKISTSIVNKVSLKWDENSYTIRIDGTMVSQGVEFVCSSEAVISDIGNTGLVVPEFEIICPINHEKTVLCWYSEEGHVETCACCGKYLSTTPVAHEHSEKHDTCLVCEYEYNFDEAYLGEGNVFEDGKQIFRLSVNKVGTVHCDYVSDYTRFELAGNHKYAMDKMAMDFDFEDELEADFGEFIYFEEDKLLATVEALPIVKLEGYCREEYNLKIRVFKNVEIELTEEQQEAVAQTKFVDEISEIYWEALGAPEKLSDLTAKFGTESVSFEVSNLVHAHDLATPVQYKIDDCHYVAVGTCKDCGQSPQVFKSENHDYESTVITPEWGDNENYYYFTGVCSKCGEHDEYVYGFLKSSAAAHGNVMVYMYSADGKPYTSFPREVPHIDSNHDGKCDFCGENMPE